ncbi:hypothetical protein PIB30_086425 [Stylosanthes scabra]|uniref:Uncharacterized protein n=1 Tax=Stylosanthes scabra TaxID=79078 RepID=A0ABU6TSM6_9FABA|nr:hypothetical protein [Stylosanthes scabra]
MGFGPSGPNIRNSCPELRNADVADVPGFMSCQKFLAFYLSFVPRILSSGSFPFCFEGFSFCYSLQFQVTFFFVDLLTFAFLFLVFSFSSIGVVLVRCGCLGRLSFPIGLMSPLIGRGWRFYPPHFFQTFEILPSALSLVLFSLLSIRWKMAENRPGDRDATAAAVQIPHERPSIYRWVANDVLGALSILDQRYLDELKETEILFGGGGLEQRYRVEATRRGERVCYLNLDHPTIPHWLWVNEVMFTDFWVWVPFTNFQQRLLNWASVAPSQLHPNAWASIRCFELVTEFLQLPQEPEVFLCLFKFYSSNTSGRTKKGYKSVRPMKNQKIFTLYEDSFHDFKGRYFNIFAVGDHRPFWLSLEGDGLFPLYWSDQAGFDIAPVKYEGLNVDKRDTADILTFFFSKNNLSSKSLLSSPEESQKAIGNLGNFTSDSSSFFIFLSLPSSSAAVPVSAAQVVPAESVGKTQAEPDRGSSTNVGNVGIGDQHVEVSSPAREEITL